MSYAVTSGVWGPAWTGWARVGRSRLRQLGGHQVGDLAEATVPGVEVEAGSDLRKNVIEGIHYALQPHTHNNNLCVSLQQNSQICWPRITEGTGMPPLAVVPVNMFAL